jgi:hopanoid biosynthesis associated radical SAM protein HpnH
VVSIPGGEPLIHKDIAEIVKAIVARRRFVYLCTNALLVEKKLDQFEPSPYLTLSIHLDGLREHHDRSVCRAGVFDRAIAAIRLLRTRGFRVNVNATLFDGAAPDEVAAFFDYVSDELDVEGITVSPGYAYERAPDQAHFLNRRKTKQLFRDVFARGRGRPWRLSHSSLYLDFLAGNQEYRCTPWGNPTRNIFGWQRPCYLLGEGYASSFKELMETTDWDRYGTGNYEKCANCMAHCGYEATAVTDAIRRPLKAMRVAMRAIRTEGPMAPEIPLDGQRPAEYVFEALVQQAATVSPEDERPPRRRSHAA